MVSRRLQDLISLTELTAEEIAQILDLAVSLRSEREIHRYALLGYTIALYLQDDASENRATYESSIYQIGGFPKHIDGNKRQPGRYAYYAGPAREISRYADVIIAGISSHEGFLQLAENATVPVINASSDLYNPCQALADLLTIREAKGSLRGLKLAFVGSVSNIAHSLIIGGAKMGMHVAVVHPEGFGPRPDVVESSKRFAKESGGSVTVSIHLSDIEGADVIYTDLWPAIGNGIKSADKASTEVLLIEDNPVDASLVLEMLADRSRNNFSVQWADRLSTGLRFLAERKSDALLLDLALPESRGLETFRRAHRYAPSLPIIILTGTNDEQLATKAMQRGAQDYLVKGTVNAGGLQRTIRYAVERSRSEAAAEEAAYVKRTKDFMFMPYQVNTELVARARPNAVVMHGRPVQYGDEVSGDVVVSPQSLILEQSLMPDHRKNIVSIQKAIMLRLTGVLT